MSLPSISEFFLAFLPGLTIHAAFNYWAPFLINAVVFIIRTKKDIESDIEYAKEFGNIRYVPHCSVGTIFFRVLGVVVPFVNAVVLIVDTGWGFVSKIGEYLQRTFSFPIAKLFIPNTKQEK